MQFQKECCTDQLVRECTIVNEWHLNYFFGDRQSNWVGNEFPPRLNRGLNSGQALRLRSGHACSLPLRPPARLLVYPDVTIEVLLQD